MSACKLRGVLGAGHGHTTSTVDSRLMAVDRTSS
jgi:hypothetical protein